jgi:RNA polymerase sigma-B factor
VVAISLVNDCTLASDGPAGRAGDDRPTPELVKAWLAEFSVTRDPRLRDRIVLAHLGLAERLAARFHEGPTTTHEDLQQTARMGLVAAVNRYDLTRGVPFLSYAVACVVGELKRMLRDTTWRLHVTRRTKDLALRVMPEIDRLRATLRRSPTLAELAAGLDTTEEQITEALEAVNSRTVLSLDRPSTGEDDDSSLPLADVLVTDTADDELVDLLLLPELIERLPDAERRAVVLYFFDELRQRDIAELLSCSQMQVSRLLTRAIGRLRAMLLLP